jgi:hypothetical protein
MRSMSSQTIPKIDKSSLLIITDYLLQSFPQAPTIKDTEFDKTTGWYLLN